MGCPVRWERSHGLNKCQPGPCPLLLFCRRQPVREYTWFLMLTSTILLSLLTLLNALEMKRKFYLFESQIYTRECLQQKTKKKRKVHERLEFHSKWKISGNNESKFRNYFGNFFAKFLLLSIHLLHPKWKTVCVIPEGAARIWLPFGAVLYWFNSD